ncbi:Putative L-galactonate oxidoreductase [Lacunisphaera limnophila]|uniref:L-galactonate oxidoreductase n=1 Tax=Lacunisphaera limnophila TaxID=1838286 RepID=A0A1D8ATU5_9BACT|nr:zinc-binding alcohol dehydrogenase family protein [Lacunisphaera limnophila]AOS44276.1 Putative L-galactonate oxidoreductase [Lacunisphaera limnophila]
MLTITLDQPGQFSAADRPEPTPSPGTALVRVHRLGVCGTDLHAFAGKQPFFTYPRVLGHELGVEVIDPGDTPHGLRAGDRCSVEPYLNCGTCIACRRGKPNCCAALQVMGVHVDGGMRPLLRVPARKLHPSTRLDYEQLALVETLGIGAHAVERAAPTADDFILVIGAGPIGLSVIQFAKVTGATLAVMDVSDTRLDFCRQQLGVTHTLKPGATAVADLKTIGGGDLPTVVIDATGNPGSMMGCFDLPAHGGRIVFVGLFQGDVTFNDPNFHRRELTVMGSRNALPATFREVIRLVEEGKVDTRPWITHRFKLAETPTVFPRDIAGNPAVLKAMIEVS